MLKTNLISLFMVDEFRRVATEVILPMFLQNSEKIAEKLKSLKRKVEENSEESAENLRD